MPRIQRALLSVSDKTGLIDFARGLVAASVELVSTGGTAERLRAAGLPVQDVAAVTGFPEMLDGRVKTLHPAIHGGLLAVRGNPAHEAAIAAHGIRPFDLVAINLYPFEATVARPNVTLAEAVEQIDIGGPAMLRSAAKNFEGVAVLVDPTDYPAVLQEIQARGEIARTTRYTLARKAFAHTARYDQRIAAFLDRVELQASPADRPAVLRTAALPAELHLALEKVQDLRYGENPHQRAAFYRHAGPPTGLAAARQLQGKELSHNNLLDLQAAWELVQEFAEPVVAIIKHTNPCGVATGPSLLEAFRRARATDPLSAFGGILALNRPLDGPTAAALAEFFVEAAIAPGYAPEALEALRSKKNLRLLELPPATPGAAAPSLDLDLRRIGGGLLVQEPDRVDLDPAALRVVTKRPPTPAEERALRFAWTVVKHVKSNAIVLATDGATVGIGAGQMSRVDSVKLACFKAQAPTRGTVLASDAFFPFRDGVDAAAAAGVTAVIQPGGSIRDAEVIAAADEHAMAMLFTGIRHFRH